MQAIKPHLSDDAGEVLALVPQELASHVLEYLGRHRGELGRIRALPGVPVFCLEDLVRAATGEQHSSVHRYPENVRGPVVQAILEAFNWLMSHGVLAVVNDGGRDWYFITRLGCSLLEANGWHRFVEAQRLPKELLHPTIERASWPAFIRGEYDSAVFSAFKQVEVAVREAAGFGPDQYGTSMMRSAFDPKGGPLTDLATPRAERQALSDLFAGAIASYKNPHSHRHVEIGPSEAGEMIVLASHLLRILSGREKAAEGSIPRQIGSQEGGSGG